MVLPGDERVGIASLEQTAERDIVVSWRADFPDGGGFLDYYEVQASTSMTMTDTGYVPGAGVQPARGLWALE